MKSQADKHRSEKVFVSTGYVLVKLKLSSQVFVQRRSSAKLFPRYYDPFRVLCRLGGVAYELDLPPSSRIHKVFHISLLKGYKRPIDSTMVRLPPADKENQPFEIPEAIMGRKTTWKNGECIAEGLVKWSGSGLENATLEPLELLIRTHPELLSSWHDMHLSKADKTTFLQSHMQK